MKFLYYTLFASIIVIFSTSCSSTNYEFKLNTSKKTTLGENITINFQKIKGGKIDSVQLFVGNKKLKITNNTSKVNSNTIGIGKHNVTALVFTPNQVQKIENTIEVFPKTTPKLYDYKIINEYPHDTKSYTQGLEFHNGYLYETTGRIGQSWLRKIDYKTGKVLQQKNLNEYFGEGMTFFNNAIYWLSWQGGRGFTFNTEDFKETGKFLYNKSLEGWGLTHNNTHLIKTDGSNTIWFLDSNGKEDYKIQAYTNKDAIDRLNEIEYVDGKIYANRWITETPVKSIIVVIDEKTGIVEGVINLNKLREKILETQKLNTDEVLNGIAYNPNTETFFITGKHWGKLFEIKIIKP